MLASLVIGAGAGHLYGVPGLSNTATTFGALWIAGKWIELSELGVSWPIIVMGGSVATYYSALWLHANPQFVLSLARNLEIESSNKVSYGAHHNPILKTILENGADIRPK